MDCKQDHKASGKRPGPAANHPPNTGSPCGACKFLRRKCVPGCVFAAHFAMEQGAAKFAAVHKVFGASNVSKLLQHIPASRRQDAVLTICYEAQARLNDPVYGCVSTIFGLQRQVASLQTELSVMQAFLINNRIAAANAIHGSQQIHQHCASLQPAYSNTSSASNNVVSLSSSFPSSGMDLADAAQGCFDPLRLGQPLQDEDEEDSHNLVAFTNGMFQNK